MAFDVFISYSSSDREVADRVCATLEGTGIACCIAPRDLQPGEGYAGALVEAIARSRVMVLIFSSRSNASPQVRREVEKAVSRNLRLIPFRIENTLPTGDLDYLISSLHWLDAYSGSVDRYLPKLVETVRSALSPEEKTEPVRPPSRPARIRHQRRLTILLPLILVVALLVSLQVRKKITPPYGDPPDSLLSYRNGRFELVSITPSGYASAMKYLEDLLKRRPGFSAGYSGLAAARLGYFEEFGVSDRHWIDSVETYCARAIALDSANQEAFAILGRYYYYATSDLKKSIQYLERALELDPDDIASLAMIGRVNLEELNDPGEAVKYLSRASTIAPMNSSNHMNLAIGLYAIERYQEAFAEIQKALRINQKDPDIWLTLAAYYERINSPDSAIYAYKRARELDPGSGRATEYLASLLASLGRTREGDSLLREATATDIYNFRLIYLRGVILFLSGDAKAASESWRRSYQIAFGQRTKDSGDALPVVFMGLNAARLGNESDALRYIDEAKRIDTIHSDIVIGISRIYAVLKKAIPMRQWFRSARQKSIDIDEAYVRTEPDFMDYRTDEELISITRRR